MGDKSGIQGCCTESQKGSASARSLYLPPSPRVIEILDEEVCTYVTLVTPFTVHCILFLLPHTKMLLTTSHLHRIR